MTAKRQPRFNASRDRLEEMITLVQSYRGWSQKQVAEELNRNVHALVPDSGNPKLDLVVTLSRILDWPIEMIVADLRAAEVECAAPRPGESSPSARDAAALIRTAWECAEAERWDDVLAATDPESFEGVDGETRGHLLMYRQWALESMGQYLAAIECCRVGLEAVSHRSEAAYRLRTALAYNLAITGAVDEADGIASTVIAELAAVAPEHPRRERLAFALLVRGMANRQLAVRGTARELMQLREAGEFFDRAASIFSDFPRYGGSPRNAAIASTARAAACEVRILLGEAPANDLVQQAIAAFDARPDLSVIDSSTAETLGWCCIYASRAILADPSSVADPQRDLAVLTNKADEVAERLGHWALREQLFSIEHLHRVLAAREGGEPLEWNLDDDDVRVLMGTMGRFPRFRKLGWQILAAVRQERREGSP